MSLNPYESPTGIESLDPSLTEPVKSYSAGRVASPAICLIAVAVLSIVCLTLSLVIHGLVLTSGMDEWEQPVGAAKRAQVTIRLIWGGILLLANIGTLYGAIQMLRLQSHSAAKLGCALAAIPCFSACLLLGVPFGIWGYIVLSDPKIQEEFRS